MQIIECEKREGALLAALVDVWERSVRATHAFLSEEEILAIREFVPQALSGVERLVVALEGGVPLGFRTYKRTELDEEGRPYPLLYMKLCCAN